MVSSGLTDAPTYILIMCYIAIRFEVGKFQILIDYINQEQISDGKGPMIS